MTAKGRGQGSAPKNGAVRELIANGGDGILRILSESVLWARQQIAGRAGLSFGGRRDLYQALGYKLNLTWQDYFDMYRRGGLGRAVIDGPIEDCWSVPPTISEKAGTETTFEKEWKELAKAFGIWNKFERLDRLASIGTFAVFVMGFSDGAELDQPLQAAGGNRKLVWASPYPESNVSVAEYEKDPKNPRFGLPLIYSVSRNTTGAGATEATSVRVHHSRVIHVAEDELCEDGVGTPAMESVYNWLQDVEKVVGASAEVYWRNARRVVGLEIDKDANNLDPDTIETEMDDFVHKLKDWFLIQGAKPHMFEAGVVDPKGTFDVLVQAIAAQKRVPVRIFLGSERGELASSQDERAYRGRMQTRRTQHCEPRIVRPFIDTLIFAGAITKPSSYEVVWTPMEDQSPKDVAEYAKLIAGALKDYATAPGADAVMPVPALLKYVLKLTDEQIADVEKMVADMIGEERVDVAAGAPADPAIDGRRTGSTAGRSQDSSSNRQPAGTAA